MTDAQESWKELGDQLRSLGLKLKLHFEEEAGGNAAVVGDSLKAGLERVGKTLGDAFEALGDAVDDEAVRADAQDAGRLLLDAVQQTFSEASEALHDRLRSS